MHCQSCFSTAMPFLNLLKHGSILHQMETEWLWTAVFMLGGHFQSHQLRSCQKWEADKYQDVIRVYILIEVPQVCFCCLLPKLNPWVSSLRYHLWPAIKLSLQLLFVLPPFNKLLEPTFVQEVITYWHFHHCLTCCPCLHMQRKSSVKTEVFNLVTNCWGLNLITIVAKEVDNQCLGEKWDSQFLNFNIASTASVTSG